MSRFWLIACVSCFSFGQSTSAMDQVLGSLMEVWQSSRQELGRSLAEDFSDPVVDITKQEIRYGEQIIPLDTSPPPLYTVVKNFSHIPVAIFWLLYPYQDTVLSSSQIAQLKDYRQQVVQSINWQRLHRDGIDQETFARLELFVTDSLSFIDTTLEQGKVAARELFTFCRSLRQPIVASAHQIGELTVQKLHRDIEQGLKDISPEARQVARMTMVGAPGHRNGDININYFAARWNVPGEGARIHFFESAFAPGEGERRWRVRLAHEKLGELFWQNPEALEQDPR